MNRVCPQLFQCSVSHFAFQLVYVSRVRVQVFDGQHPSMKSECVFQQHKWCETLVCISVGILFWTEVKLSALIACILSFSPRRGGSLKETSARTTAVVSHHRSFWQTRDLAFCLRSLLCRKTKHTRCRSHRTPAKSYYIHSTQLIMTSLFWTVSPSHHVPLSFLFVYLETGI